jgi:methylated-DNA-[protein]-cysteine S-methyltransferase
MTSALAGTTISTPLGGFTVIADDEGVHGAGFADSIDELRAHLRGPVRHAVVRRDSALHVRHGIDAYFDGDLQALDRIVVRQPGSPLFLRAWSVLRDTQPGEQLAYAQLARIAGSPGAIRAAASACARNNVCLVIPCHRVIRSDGSLGGYGYGLDRKRGLLAHEERHSS